MLRGRDSGRSTSCNTTRAVLTPNATCWTGRPWIRVYCSAFMMTRLTLVPGARLRFKYGGVRGSGRNPVRHRLLESGSGCGFVLGRARTTLNGLLPESRQVRD